MGRGSRKNELHHFDIDRNAGRQVDIGESFDHFALGIEDIDHAFVNAHFKLLPGILVDERGAVDRVFSDVDRKGDGANDRGVVTGGHVNDLLHRLVENAVLIGADANSQAMCALGFLRSR